MIDGINNKKPELQKQADEVAAILASSDGSKLPSSGSHGLMLTMGGAKTTVNNYSYNNYSINGVDLAGNPRAEKAAGDLWREVRRNIRSGV